MFIYPLLCHEMRPAPNLDSVLSLAYSSVFQSSLQSCQCSLLLLFPCMALSKSCPSCLHFISVPCHFFLPISSFFSSSAFHKFLIPPFYSAFMILMCFFTSQAIFFLPLCTFPSIKCSGISISQMKSQGFLSWNFFY